MSNPGSIDSGSRRIGAGSSTNVAAATKVQLPDNQCVSVVLTSPPGNGGIIWYGNSDVVAVAGSEKGAVLFASQSSQKLEISNTSLIYWDTTNSGDKLAFVFFN